MGGQQDSFTDLFQAQNRILKHTMSYINSSSLKCAIQLGIFDAIHNNGKPMALSELVAALNIKSDKTQGMQRLMRVLTHSGFISKSKVGDGDQGKGKENEGFYTLTPSSHLFLDDENCVLKPFLMFNNDPIVRKSWDFMSDWFQNDDSSPFDTAHGRNFWEYNASEPRLSGLFNKINEGECALVANLMIKECRGVFEGLTSLADIGGGTGIFSRVIAQTFPHIKCTVFDLPDVVANLHGSENLEFQGGDMFEAIPSANAVLLKAVLHILSDLDCVKILKKCKEAIPSKEEGGKVIIIDMVIDGQKDEDDELKLLFDMLMTVVQGGYERNEKEWKELFDSAGFTQYKITKKLCSKTVIEVYP